MMTATKPRSELELMFKQLLASQSGENPAELTRKPYSRHPPALITNCVREMSHLKIILELNDIQHDAIDLLNEYRKSKNKGPQDGLIYSFEYIFSMVKPGVTEALRSLDNAFQMIHEYRPEEHFTEQMYRYSNSKTASHKQTKNTITEDIKQAIMARYMNAKHGEKGTVKKDIANRHGISARKIDGLIKQLKSTK